MSTKKSNQAKVIVKRHELIVLRTAKPTMVARPKPAPRPGATKTA